MTIATVEAAIKDDVVGYWPTVKAWLAAKWIIVLAFIVAQKKWLIAAAAIAFVWIGLSLIFHKHTARHIAVTAPIVLPYTVTKTADCPPAIVQHTKVHKRIVQAAPAQKAPANCPFLFWDSPCK